MQLVLPSDPEEQNATPSVLSHCIRIVIPIASSGSSPRAIAIPIISDNHSNTYQIVRDSRSYFNFGHAAKPPKSSESPAASATPKDGGAAAASSHKCDFETMQNFFDHATSRNLNITVEVQNCQKLCLLTYGVGNPDLSGIVMMYAYTVQTGLTILLGPAYRTLHLFLSPASEVVRELKAVQVVFFASNGFFVVASAVASLVRLSQNPSIFEIAEMQAMAFLQVNSILVIFFCMVLVQSMARWAARVLMYIVVFVLVIIDRNSWATMNRAVPDRYSTLKQDCERLAMT